VSGAFYYQIVEKMRPDVLVIDKAMLRDRPWYYSYLKQRAPEVFRRVEPQLQEFLKYLVPFDRGEPFDQAAIAPAYQRFTEALVSKNLDRPIFVGIDAVEEPDELFAPQMVKIPAGVAFRLLPVAAPDSSKAPSIVWRDANYTRRNYYTDNARLRQALPLAATAEARARAGDMVAAKQFIERALVFAPKSSPNLDDIAEKDREIAQMTDEKFAQIRQMEASFGAAQSR
jgi:hypothetical protein